MSNQANGSMKMLGSGPYNTRVCVGGWQTPTSHLSVTAGLVPNDVFVEDFIQL